MHIKTIEAVKKYLLYRPMVPGERDILFSAKASTSGRPEVDLQKDFEVTHLTCFIGGMFGLGGKIFNRPEDVELAIKLTDGCVWAYESMPSGIMPEGASVVPCQSMKSCPWNETVWWAHLDPSRAYREIELETYNQKQAEKKRQADWLRKGKEERKEAAALREAAGETPLLIDRATKTPRPRPTSNTYPRPEPGSTGNKAESESPFSPLDKREPLPPAGAEDPRQPTKTQKSNSELKDKLDLNHPVDDGGIEVLPPHAGGIIGEISVDDTPDPQRPLSHEEYVRSKIKRERIPPGFVSISYRSYILR
jgi:mannosyl-oligosaccharide alpha-1,2-mannosidase